MQFKEYQPYVSPTYFQEDYYKRSFEEIYGIAKDDIVGSAKNAVKAGLVQFADDYALNSLGHNFNIDRPPTFDTTQWRVKLGKAWDFWQGSGTPARLITEIKDLGFPNVYILPQYIESPPGVFTKTLPNVVDVNPAIENPDPKITSYFWSNFWVVIDQPHPFIARKWGSVNAGKWNMGPNGLSYLWGSVVGDPALMAYLKALIKKLKPGWTMCRGIVFLFNAAKVWAEPNYNDGTLWGLSPMDYAIERILENWELPSV